MMGNQNGRTDLKWKKNFKIANHFTSNNHIGNTKMDVRST